MAINDRFDSVLTGMRDHQEDLYQALNDYVWDYYRNYSDATHLEPEVTDAMAVLLREGFLYSSRDVAHIVATAERDINRLGGVIGEDGRAHAVCTFPDYDPDEN